ncbi:unnamed protein product [Camellia sinensis]
MGWVKDSSYPLFNSKKCPFIENDFNCLKNGRPDLRYLKYKWQPHRAATYLGFDGRVVLKRFEGKSIMFVGDSMSQNQWQSLICMLYTTTPTLKYTDMLKVMCDQSVFLVDVVRENRGKILKLDSIQVTQPWDYIQLGNQVVNDMNRLSAMEQALITWGRWVDSNVDYKLKVMYNQSLFLVDVVRENTGKILKLNSIQGGRKWIGIHMLIFNIWYWWYRRGVTQPWDYIQLGNPVVNDMNRLYAMEQALIAWSHWVDSNVVSNKTLVFFQGVSPIPYNEWKEPKANSCKGQMKPVSGSTYPRQLPPAMAVMKEVLRGIRMPVTLLDVTLLLQLRKDGHPSIYGGSGPRVMDCTLWCTAGVPDTSNQILYNFIFKKR